MEARSIPGLLTPPEPALAQVERPIVEAPPEPTPISDAPITKPDRWDDLRRLWRGEQPLGRAFWRYFVLGTYAVVFVALLPAIALYAIGLRPGAAPLLRRLQHLPRFRSGRRLAQLIVADWTRCPREAGNYWPLRLGDIPSRQWRGFAHHGYVHQPMIA